MNGRRTSAPSLSLPPPSVQAQCARAHRFLVVGGAVRCCLARVAVFPLPTALRHSTDFSVRTDGSTENQIHCNHVEYLQIPWLTWTPRESLPYLS